MSEQELREGSRLSRRAVLKAAALGTMATGISAFLAACGVKTSSSGAASSAASAGSSVAPSGGASVAPSAAEAIPFKIGFVSPQTGPAAGFGEPDPYVIGLVQDKLNQGFQAGGKNYAITIVQKDGQSDPAKAAQVANDLITTDKVDLILATSTPENNNPIADAAEAAGVPMIATVEPWEAFVFPRQKDPAKPVPFKFTYI
ncbi:MAG TPA: ABC transporter substrate-binding protein, partial [Candidatus Limnocylindrales bacterium]